MTEPAQDKSTHWERFILWFLGTVCFLMAGKVLFFAALDRAHATSLRATCLFHLRQVGLAIAVYSQDNGGKCPVDSVSPTLVGSLQLLHKSRDLLPFLHCPRDTRPGAKPAKKWEQLTTDNISYSYVPNLIWQSSTPDSIVALDRIYVTAAGSSWPSTGNHKDMGGNILFDDGHVDFKTRLPSALKDKDGKEIVLSP